MLHKQLYSDPVVRGSTEKKEEKKNNFEICSVFVSRDRREWSFVKNDKAVFDHVNQYW